MKSFIVIVAFCAVAVYGAPQNPNEIRILSQDTDIQPDGSYKYSYETENGIKGEEVGTLKKASSPDTSDVIIVQGSNSYTSPEGQVISLQYVADDVGGFQPQGDHIPTPPPVPEAIARALAYIAANPAKNV